MPTLPSPFDVEQFRTEPHRLGIARVVAQPTVVLGSTQSAALIDHAALDAGGVELAQRRGGGGAVYLGPDEQLWLDVWIPRNDPLWMVDVSAAAEWVGAWWTSALAAVGWQNLTVHHGRSVPGEFGDLVCFAGRGPGEVFDGDRKVVGLSQWRSRQGALFSSCAYLHWDPAPLLALLDGEVVGARGELGRRLAATAVGLAELGPVVGAGSGSVIGAGSGSTDLGAVRAVLLGSLPDFEMTVPPGL